ncbi:hypothetical protein [Actinomadura rugatobispora]|uniref:LPXTG cell wall anchor domain-containing protein n=1 Tax=Actinomadura rugatobispora TaxID=1994 RepID=A0ABW1A3I9_9ACTN|nr:hypothetical protein GCM10010200_010940 [Actinomadura rugatobispora]
MTIRRLAAAGAAGVAAVALSAGPAWADPKISATPDPFVPGGKLNLKATECDTKPVQEEDGGLFTGFPVWEKAGDNGTWTAVATTNKVAPGKTYQAFFTCEMEGEEFTLRVSVTAEDDDEPEQPKFDFGYDDVKLSTTRVVPNGKTTFTVTCPTEVTITGNGYTQNPLPVKKAGEKTWTATGTFKSSLPDPTLATVTCKNHGSVKYSTSPEKGDLSPKKPTGKIPTGRIDTGDGSTVAGGGGSAALLAGGSAAVLAAAGAGVVLLRRRGIGQERS